MAFVGDLHMDVRDAFADKLKNRLLACIRIGDFRLDDEGRCRDVLHDVECLFAAPVVDMEGEGHLSHVGDVVGYVETEGIDNGDGLVCRNVLVLVAALCDFNVR